MFKTFDNLSNFNKSRSGFINRSDSRSQTLTSKISPKQSEIHRNLPDHSQSNIIIDKKIQVENWIAEEYFKRDDHV